MLKLYKRLKDQTLYWETWEKDKKTAIVHWGVIGNVGQDKKVESKLLSSYKKQIQSEINLMIKDGYEEVDIDDQYILLIEFKVDGMGTPEDLAKRARLEQRMNSTLGWTGLGHCDGGSIGSGTMEVCCIVIDFGIAKAIITKDLEGTEFQNYIRIFDENE